MDAGDNVLEFHVRESNAIEGIDAEPGTPLFDGHLEAARVAAKGKLVHPHELHKKLFEGVSGADLEPGLVPGEYRDCEVRVGDRIMPRFVHVPVLMTRWLKLIEDFTRGQYPESSKDAVYNAYYLHNWFLCIHPYLDGNGRSARLILNMLLRSRGLPWEIIFSAEAPAYYMKIRIFEEIVFKKKHSYVYS